MNELKTRTMEVINQINQDWVGALKTAEENNAGVDITEMMGKFSANLVKLDNYFREAEMRVKKPKKSLFGR